eukprot:gnl/TRDRNA2_/TRDRNA2_39604_c0_seq1.p1 gnl/TRDRNA2_/TRDRNA2_39604_c0~~gnl/TRDRNA2_/TRDRNA2_39604_c0_seq1.p1  ORF type:complete len:106 (+),score=13.77 gnl/TRDRNA2_/TRDRNA2_39604_c0_seq1:35-319(+)
MISALPPSAAPISGVCLPMLRFCTFAPACSKIRTVSALPLMPAQKSADCCPGSSKSTGTPEVSALETPGASPAIAASMRSMLSRRQWAWPETNA